MLVTTILEQRSENQAMKEVAALTMRKKQRKLRWAAANILLSVFALFGLALGLLLYFFP